MDCEDIFTGQGGYRDLVALSICPELDQEVLIGSNSEYLNNVIIFSVFSSIGGIILLLLFIIMIRSCRKS
jgi:hypothetical protein